MKKLIFLTMIMALMVTSFASAEIITPVSCTLEYGGVCANGFDGDNDTFMNVDMSGSGLYYMYDLSEYVGQDVTVQLIWEGDFDYSEDGSGGYLTLVCHPNILFTQQYDEFSGGVYSFSKTTTAKVTVPVDCLKNDSYFTFDDSETIGPNRLYLYEIIIEATSLTTPPSIIARSPLTDPTVVQGDSQPFSITVYEADGDPLSYSWLVGGVDVGNNLSSLTIDTTALLGVVPVEVTVFDVDGNDTTSWSLTVNEYVYEGSVAVDELDEVIVDGVGALGVAFRDIAPLIAFLVFVFGGIAYLNLKPKLTKR